TRNLSSPMRSPVAGLCLVISLVSALPSRGQTQPTKESLPSGVLLRLGRVGGNNADDGHTARVSAVAFSPDAKPIPTGGWDGAVCLWDGSPGKLLKRVDAHSATVFYVAFSPDGKTLASGSGDHSVRLWDAADGSEVRRFDGHEGAVFGVTFRPDGKTL